MNASEVKQNQRACVQFCYRLQFTATQTYDYIRLAYGSQTIDRATIFRWYALLKGGRESVELIPHGGRPATASTEVNVNTIQALILEDRFLSCRQIAAIMNISKSSVINILSDKLKMRRVSSCWVPHHLTTEQLENRVRVCREWKKLIRNDPDYMSQVITCDETWARSSKQMTKLFMLAKLSSISSPPLRI